MLDPKNAAYHYRLFVLRRSNSSDIWKYPLSDDLNTHVPVIQRYFVAAGHSHSEGLWTVRFPPLS